MIGYLSGQMFVDAMLSCGGAPTRDCVMDYCRGAKDFDGGGLLGAVTPFRTTRVDCREGCGNFGGHGTYDFKWITPCIVLVRVVAHGGNLDTPEIRAGTTVYLGVNVSGALFASAARSVQVPLASVL